MFNKVVLLTVNQRVQGSDAGQVRFRDLLLRLRSGNSTDNDWKLLLTRQPTCVADLDSFKHVTRLYFTNEEVAKYNYTRLTQLQCPIATIYARHSSEKAKIIKPQDFYGLEPQLLIAKGALVMLTMNLWASVGLCNGAKGTVINIIYQPNHQPPDLPIAVIVKFHNYKGPSLSGYPSCVPISPITVSVHSEHERQQLPLRLAWALTIHKSQGMTLTKSWVDIGKKESTLGITYLAISRVRNLSSLVIEPMTLERLKNIKKMPTLKYRLTEEKRLLQISRQTVTV